MFVRDGAVWAKVEWTDKGRESIEKKYIKYISPEMAVDKKTNRVLEILAAGLVLRPAITQLPALAAQERGERKMDKAILDLLGLAEGATTEEVVAAIQALQEKANAAAAEAEGDVAKAEEEKATAKAMQDLRVELAKASKRVSDLEAAAHAKEVNEVVDGAIKEGKITPACREYFVAHCKSEADIGDLSKMLAASGKVIADVNVNSGAVAATAKKLNDEEAEICRVMRIKPEDFIAAKAEQEKI
jgi:phage I-like protein